MGDSVKQTLPLVGLAGLATVAAPGLLSQAGSWIAANPGTALSGLGTLAGGIGGMQAARARENALKIQQAEAALRLSEAERDTQERLSRLLSRQNNFFAAIGTDPGRGPALRARQAAAAQAERELSVLAARRRLGDLSHAVRRRRARRAGRFGAANALVKFGERIL